MLFLPHDYRNGPSHPPLQHHSYPQAVGIPSYRRGGLRAMSQRRQQERCQHRRTAHGKLAHVRHQILPLLLPFNVQDLRRTDRPVPRRDYRSLMCMSTSTLEHLL